MKSSVRIGSISSGTMRPEDLVPDLLDTLRDIVGESDTWAKLADRFDAIWTDDGIEDQEEAGYLLEDLFIALEGHAPDFCYFGAHEGDGSDYGFWVSWDSVRIAIKDEEMVEVSDLSKVPAGWTGYVLEVNDHGNCTLYFGENEIWSVI